ncbi:MAG: hypothetical protein QXS48_00760 [Candidatus Aenigmatarchaeota archaeon]
MGGLGVPPEKTAERINEILSRRKSLPAYIQKIQEEDVFATLALAGGEAYIEDIKWTLESLFGYKIEKIEDLEDFLKGYRGMGLNSEWDEKREKDYWKLDKTFFKKHQKEIEERMRKALGYQKSGLEALFSEEEEGKEIDLWGNYKGKV